MALGWCGVDMLATISAKGMRDYKVTAEDKLWLLRAVHAEGKVHSEVAEALVNLFAATRARGVTQSLERLVRAYAQPVNPRWFPDGDLFLRKLGREPDSEVALRAAALRRRDVHSKQVDFPPHVVRAVDYALSGVHQTDVTDYAAHWHDASSKYVARSEVTPGVNRMWTRFPGWSGYSVAVDGQTAVDEVPGGSAGLVAVLLAVTAIWALLAKA